MTGKSNLITTTPATVKAYLVDCDRDCGDNSIVYHYEPIIAWMHEIDPVSLETGGRSCFPITALYGVRTTEYAVYFPEEDYWQIHQDSPEMPGDISAKGKAELEKHLASLLEKEEVKQ
ncbi:MAG: hypothetical protein ACR2PX_16095 [Endozoicomonas sp.]|uniref:hypothetical protein n=1 Tax=Endozoicomonas sp. TaxID=1892382 RepID=UPI003D9AC19A